MKWLKMTFVVLGTVSVMVSGCKKKEAPTEAQGPQMVPTVVMPKGKTQIVVPPEVKETWKAVRIEIEDKKTNKKSEVVININSEYTIPGTNLKIKVGEFLPDFRMDGLTITSASNNLNNPAVHIRVFEDEKEIFKGWLYQKFPTIHPFQHERYKLTLLEGIKARKG